MEQLTPEKFGNFERKRIPIKEMTFSKIQEDKTEIKQETKCHRTGTIREKKDSGGNKLLKLKESNRRTGK